MKQIFETGQGKITNSLNPGIGTTSPNYKLDVNGNINATSYNNLETDYTEWVEKLDLQESIAAGDVVEIVGGKITKFDNPGTAAKHPVIHM